MEEKNATATEEAQEVFFELENGEFAKIDMTLPLQVLFDDVMSFVSQEDF
ncbi:MAG: hypothetical protein LKG27_07345 [Clostridiaceae bacterium]|jgi:hypothetical protein|nr:hypothetical protein [Clostridiaceae bacterium]